jgi:hypothetical protein
LRVFPRETVFPLPLPSLPSGYGSVTDMASPTMENSQCLTVVLPKNKQRLFLYICITFCYFHRFFHWTVYLFVNKLSILYSLSMSTVCLCYCLYFFITHSLPCKPEKEGTKIISTEVFVFCQLTNHKREFLSQNLDFLLYGPWG